MEIVLLPSLSKRQKAQLPKNYAAPPIEGMYNINEAHPDGIIFVYVGGCDWQTNFEHCIKEFVLTVFHETMHILCLDIDDYVPYAERVLGEILNSDVAKNQEA